MTVVNLNPEQFGDAGGRLSLDEWVQLDSAEQEALAAAGRAAQERLAASIADAVMRVVADALEDMRLAALAESVPE